MTFHIFLFVFRTSIFFLKYHYSRDLFIVHYISSQIIMDTL